MKVLIKAGAEVDIPTRAEMAEDMRATWRSEQEIENARQREAVRGFKYMRVVSRPGANKADGGGPASGYAWSLMYVGAIMSAGSDLCVFLGKLGDYTAAAGSPQNSNLPLLGAGGSGSGAASENLNQVTFGFRQQILYPDESITVVAQNSAANLLFVTVCAVQFPAEKIGVIIA